MMRNRFLKPALVVSMLACIAHAEPRDWAYILDEQLNTVPIRIEEASSTQGITGTDQQGLRVRFLPSDIHALWIDPRPIFRDGFDAELYDQALSVELTDGQRVVMLIESSSDEDMVEGKRLESDELVTIPIDRIRSLGRTSKLTNLKSSRSFFDPQVQDDAIRLNNEDVILGFIVSIGETVQIETNSPNGQSALRNFPIDQVHAIMLQNPNEPSPGVYIMTTLNERLRTSEYKWDDDRGIIASLDDPMHANPRSQSFQSDLLGIDALPIETELIDLQSYSEAIIRPSGNREWAQEPIITTSRWLGTYRSRARIESPVSMTWELPNGASRLTMDINAWNQEWTSNRVVVSATDRNGTTHTLWSKRFDSLPTPNETLNLAIPEYSSTLRFEIDPQENGPIQDRFFLSLPMVLVESSAELQ